MRVTWRLASVDLEGIEVVLGGRVDHCEGCVLWVRVKERRCEVSVGKKVRKERGRIKTREGRGGEINPFMQKKNEER